MLRVPPLLLFLTLLLFLEGGVCYNAPTKRTVLNIREIQIRYLKKRYRESSWKPGIRKEMIEWSVE